MGGPLEVWKFRLETHHFLGGRTVSFREVQYHFGEKKSHEITTIPLVFFLGHWLLSMLEKSRRTNQLRLVVSEHTLCHTYHNFIDPQMMIFQISEPSNRIFPVWNPSKVPRFHEIHRHRNCLSFQPERPNPSLPWKCVAWTSAWCWKWLPPRLKPVKPKNKKVDPLNGKSIIWVFVFGKFPKMIKGNETSSKDLSLINCLGRCF